MQIKCGYQTNSNIITLGRRHQQQKKSPWEEAKRSNANYSINPRKREQEQREKCLV